MRHHYQLFINDSKHVATHSTNNKWLCMDPPWCFPHPRWSVFHKWMVITLKGFIRLILLTSMAQLSDTRTYWSTHVTLNFPFFRSVFSKDYFLQIFWMLHVSGIDSIRFLISIYHYHCCNNYLIPSQEMLFKEDFHFVSTIRKLAVIC